LRNQSLKGSVEIGELGNVLGLEKIFN
jgi:hypothetical protein